MGADPVSYDRRLGPLHETTGVWGSDFAIGHGLHRPERTFCEKDLLGMQAIQRWRERTASSR